MTLRGVKQQSLSQKQDVMKTGLTMGSLRPKEQTRVIDFFVHATMDSTRQNHSPLIKRY
jgi:hypothetical protein